jgi:hypothetical protein
MTGRRGPDIDAASARVSARQVLMNIDNPQVAINIPSTRRLVRATAIAVTVAAVLLVTVVLPVEYGLDRLGTGKALGLMVLTDPVTAPPPGAPERGVKLVPVQNGPAALYPAEFKLDSRELALGPNEQVEFKYRLERGAAMMFSWKATGDVVHDSHGDIELELHSGSRRQLDAGGLERLAVSPDQKESVQ